jgi:hypothetical protein
VMTGAGERRLVIPDEFTGYFTAASTAAGALIGLLAIAISVRPEAVFGEEGPHAARATAASAFTALVNSFFVSLNALSPGTRLGYVAIIMALVSLVSTWQTRSHLTSQEAARAQLALAVLTYLAQLGVGIALSISPDDQGLVRAVAYLLIVSFAIALIRAGKARSPSGDRRVSIVGAPGWVRYGTGWTATAHSTASRMGAISGSIVCGPRSQFRPTTWAPSAARIRHACPGGCDLSRACKYV